MRRCRGRGLNLPQQSFYRWGVDADGLSCITAGSRTFSNTGDIEFGLLLRLRNPHHPEHRLFVCAGLGPWGTSGAAYFLPISGEPWASVMRPPSFSGSSP